MAQRGLKEKLEEKGWEPEFIDKAIDVFEKDSEDRGQIITKLDKIVYWIAMFIAITGNFIISVILIPFLVTITNKVALGVIIFAISLSFGFLFNVLLKDIEALDMEHHIIAGIFIPALALINIFVITNVSNHFIKLLNIQSQHSPFVIGAVYIIGFLTPFTTDKLFVEKRKLKKAQKSSG
ncbi:hypothetical protein GOV08_01235 [Candidatus Woesearchaeota archaeon]|nr:hypothetical protein [Candidatus Woesearchaeota archaeon]